MRRPILARAALGTLALAAIATIAAGPAAAAPTALEITAFDAAGAPDVSVTVTLPPALADAALPARAFDVRENGEPRAARVQRLPGDALEAVLVIDTSGSMTGAPMAAAKTAALAFLAQMPPSARVAVVGFSDSPVVASPLTTNRDRLAAAIGALTADGETALYDGVGLALDQLHAGDQIHRHLVLLSDGGDTASTTALDVVRRRLAGSDTRLDVAELATAESRHEPLAALAADGRGAVVSAGDPAALTPIYQALGKGLANQYVLTFPASGHGPTRVRVGIDHAGQRAATEITVDLPAAPVGQDAGATAAPSGAAVLVAGAGLCFAAMLIAASLVPYRRMRRAQLTSPTTARGSLPLLVAAKQRAVEVADDALERHGGGRGLSAALERAGIALRPGELLLAATVVAGVGFLAGTVLNGVITGVCLAAAVGLATPVGLSVLATRRQRRFSEQLGDSLQLMAGSLRSGYAVLQAIDAVAREAESPSSAEFRRVIVESRLGRDLNASLRAMALRVGGEDVEWLAQAIEINREVGGDLAEVLDNIAGTIRERQRVARQVKTLTAEGRVSAVVLVALPPLLAVVMSFMNPGYINELTHGTGLMLAGIGAVMLAAGSLVMTRMVKVEY